MNDYQPSDNAFSCQYCGRAIPERRYKNQTPEHVKFCSRNCSNAKARDRILVLNDRSDEVKMPNGTIGAISELVVCVDLMRRGYHVFRAMSPHCPCDLIAMLNGTVLRIEVRTAVVNLSGTIGYPKGSLETHEYDVLALVVRGTEVQYMPELQGIQQ